MTDPGFRWIRLVLQANCEVPVPAMGRFKSAKFDRFYKRIGTAWGSPHRCESIAILANSYVFLSNFVANLRETKCIDEILLCFISEFNEMWNSRCDATKWEFAIFYKRNGRIVMMTIQASGIFKFAMFYKRNRRNLMPEASSLNSLNSIGFISELGVFRSFWLHNSSSVSTCGRNSVYELQFV